MGAVRALGALVLGPAMAAAGGTVSQCRWESSVSCEGEPVCSYTDTAKCPDEDDQVPNMGECIASDNSFGRYSTKCKCARHGSLRRLVPKPSPALLFADDCVGDNTWGIFVFVLFCMLSATGIFIGYMKYCVQARKEGHDPCPPGTIPAPIERFISTACCSLCEACSGDHHPHGEEGKLWSRLRDCCQDIKSCVGTEAPNETGQERGAAASPDVDTMPPAGTLTENTRGLEEEAAEPPGTEEQKQAGPGDGAETSQLLSSAPVAVSGEAPTPAPAAQ